MKWLLINANQTSEAVLEDYKRKLREMSHSHTCPEHGEYVCPYSMCGIQRGLNTGDFHCRTCIMKRRGLDPTEVDRIHGIKSRQIQNKRSHRKKLSERPTNKTARGLK